jgi:hypothetical protein
VSGRVALPFVAVGEDGDGVLDTTILADQPGARHGLSLVKSVVNFAGSPRLQIPDDAKIPKEHTLVARIVRIKERVDESDP